MNYALHGPLGGRFSEAPTLSTRTAPTPPQWRSSLPTHVGLARRRLLAISNRDCSDRLVLILRSTSLNCLQLPGKALRGGTDGESETILLRSTSDSRGLVMTCSAVDPCLPIPEDLPSQPRRTQIIGIHLDSCPGGQFS